MPAKNKRFTEFARVLALDERALYEEFDPDAVAEGESDDEGALDSLDDESQLLYELLRVAQQSAHSDCMY